MKTNHFNPWIRVAWFSLVTVTLLGTSRHTIVAQSQEPQKAAPEVQQLKERLQQLEQTVLDLKGQINALEETQKNPAPKIVQADYSSAAPAAPAPADTAPKPQDSKGESTFEIYGFAMLDAGYQFKHQQLLKPNTSPPRIKRPTRSSTRWRSTTKPH